jgi:hypothetical protein
MAGGYRYVPPPDFSAGIPNYALQFKPQALDVSPLTQFVEQMTAQEKEQFRRQQLEKTAEEDKRRWGSEFGLKQNQDSRAAAAEGRNEKLFPGQLEAQNAEIAQRKAATAAAYRNSPEFRQKMLEQLQREGKTLDSPEVRYRLDGTVPGPKDALDELIARYARGVNGPAPQGAPAQAGQPQIQPQSYNGGPPAMSPMPASAPGNMTPMSAGDPNLIRVSEPAAQPQPQAAPQNGQVRVPVFGTMPKGNAEDMAMFLALKGKGDAAKMIAERANPNGLGKEAGNENDKRELAATESLSRLKEIGRNFKDEFLTYEGVAKQRGIGFLDSFETVRGKLPPDLLKSHIAFQQFRMNGVNFLTEAIKNATGAAMGVQEEPRIRSGAPDPEKDGPTAFKAKFDATVDYLAATVARTRYLRKNGFNGQPWQGDGNAAAAALPVDHFKRLIDSDGEAVMRQLRQQNPTAPEQAIKGAVKQYLNQKYEIDL